MILTVTDNPEYANAYQVMSIIDRALSSIVNDMQEAIDNIDEAQSKKEQSVASSFDYCLYSGTQDQDFLNLQHIYEAEKMRS